MQIQASRTTPKTKTITPLKGIESFSALMRTKPLVNWDACMIHALAQHSAADNETMPTAHSIALGLIVPKKAYALAVDRNRIRRVLRAQSLALSKTLPCSVNVLFRIRAGAKKGAPHAAPNVKANPHSAQFVADVARGLRQAINRVSHPKGTTP
jgi:ribonuclease P protein component